jgi:hypothetical protein
VTWLRDSKLWMGSPGMNRGISQSMDAATKNVSA